jgi:hypothetical protein
MKKQDDVRSLLNKVRKLQESNYHIGSLQSDDIKSLLEEQSRPKVKLTRLLTEDNAGEQPQEVTPDEQREEENKFKDTVSKLVKFGKIKVYRQNVEWSGELIRERVKWVYSLNESNGCYLSIESEDMLQLTVEVIETFKKLRGYYDVWSDEWSARLTGTPTEDGEGMGTAAPEGQAPANGTEGFDSNEVQTGGGNPGGF